MTKQPAYLAYWAALDKAQTAKLWWDCAPMHAAVARALQVDPQTAGAVYALAPFRYHRDGARHLILAAWPAPRIFDPVDEDWLSIEAVIAWDPVANAAWALGDPPPFNIPDDPRTQFQRWAAERAQYAMQRRKAVLNGRKPPVERPERMAA